MHVQLQTPERDLITVHFEYDLTSEDAKTSLRTVADPNPSLVPLKKSPQDELLVIDNLAELQRNCPDIGRVITYIETGELPQDGKLARQTCFEADKYYFKDGLLYHVHDQPNNNLRKVKETMQQLVVPMSWRSEVLRNYHDDNSHAGTERLYASIRQKIYWPSLYRDVRLYCRSCEICQKAKRDFHPRKPPLQPLPVVDLFARYHMDLIGPLQMSNRGYKYILLVVESLSKWPELIPLKTAESAEIANALFREVFSRFGAPAEIVSDRGSNFLLALVQHICKLFQIKRTHTSAFYPQSNAACERLNSQIYQSLRCYIDDKDNEWPELLPSVDMAYRSTVTTASTQKSPFAILYGSDMRLGVDQELIPLKSASASADEYIQRMLPRLELIRQVVKENTLKYQSNYKERYDQDAKTFEYKPGDSVWLYQNKTPIGRCKKFFRRWKTYYVSRRTSPSNYVLADATTKKEIGYPVNVSRIKPRHTTRDLFHTYDRLRSNRDARLPAAANLPQATGSAEVQPAAQNIQNQDNVIRQSKTCDSQNTQDHETSQHHQHDNIETVKKIVGVRTLNNVREYKIVWENPKLKPAWIPERDVSDYMKQMFHVTHTLRGTHRQDYRLPRRANQ